MHGEVIEQIDICHTLLIARTMAITPLKASKV